jgi:hypothetical protein
MFARGWQETRIQEKEIVIVNSDDPPKSGLIFPSTATVSLDIFLYSAKDERLAVQVR